MLVLSRNIGEEIAIANGEIVVQVVEIRGDKVRLGITAPREIDVHRMEILELIRAEDARNKNNSED